MFLRATFKSQMTIYCLALQMSLKDMLDSLTRVEREVYELVLRAGELMAKDIPLKKAWGGAESGSEGAAGGLQEACVSH